MCRAALPNSAVLDQGGACGAAGPGVSARPPALGGPGLAHAGPQAAGPLICQAHRHADRCRTQLSARRCIDPATGDRRHRDGRRGVNSFC